MCGADDCLEGVKTLGDGSPPHVRGGYTWAIAAFASLRFTPACAGRISHHCWIPRLTWVHPRMCGADQTRAGFVEGAPGSPPHVRGGYTCPPNTPSRSRVTPACAGRIRRGRSLWRVPGVHPRMCGADTHALHIAHHLVGSPPHVRGGSFKSERKSVPARFTPACAGRIF